MHNEQEIEISIKDVKSLMEIYDIEVSSLDGWVPVVDFIEKGDWLEYKLIIEDGREVLVNENHLFETIDGWEYAKNLCDKEYNFLTDSGVQKGIVKMTGNVIPIVDISVGHENQRYYTNGISSHNSGKSLTKTHLAAQFLSQGKNVLYISLEMDEIRIAERIDANLFNIPLETLKSLPKDEYVKKFKNIINKSNGRLIIKEFPPTSVSAIHFRALLNELKLKNNFIPDVLFIDYLSIVASSRMKMSNSTSYSYLKSVAEELRSIAVEFDIPIVTSQQSNRSGINSSDIDESNIAESVGIAFTADAMLALIKTDELDALGQILIKQVKNRYGSLDNPRKFVLGVDYSRMKLYDVEDFAQETIIQDSNPINKFGSESKPDKSKFSGFKI